MVPREADCGRAEQRRAPRLADEVIRGETCAQIRNNNGLGDAIVDTERVRDHHATNHRQYGCMSSVRCRKMDWSGDDSPQEPAIEMEPERNAWE
jgi:hypothetical protein